MSDSAPRKAAQANAKQADAAQAGAEESPAGQADGEEPSGEQAATGRADARQAEAGQAEAGQAGEHADGAESKPDLDEVKRKFRAALDRKREVHAEGSGKGGRDAGKIHGSHGPASGRRSFRRKSG
ncbi:DUF5302 domain-containing protein [Trebonia sp.]|uniref:DUF5302 domain-containing protein n=1 Tax=Trebonia sp. TaxID=2767075 RepID=UPI002608D4AC|nr:DUF5302 domain-containing protein [Trebonia sp.]